MTPTIGLEVGTVTRPAAYTRNAGPAVLLFSYPVASGDADPDGIAVPADGILLAGGTIAGPTAWHCSATMRWRRTRHTWSTAT